MSKLVHLVSLHLLDTWASIWLKLQGTQSSAVENSVTQKSPNMLQAAEEYIWWRQQIPWLTQLLATQMHWAYSERLRLEQSLWIS